jgi:hypothetical protein
LRFKTLLLTITAIVSASCISGCGREFNNPADPANNGGFYGGIDPKIVGTWDEITYNYNGVPSIDLKALICQSNSFVLDNQDFSDNGFVNAHNGKVFTYISNNPEPKYYFDYALNATGDSLYMARDESPQYNDPLSIHNYLVFIRSR